ncbi:hypothetical protein OUZ56_031169 [Daphnia magna]|uniref:Uncharacterized protein n=1 Tax=Daphnia magna TaxID=35525 RepID=A0ABQ9ZTG9_9CRUS|nr:hypothetical protein OUZ56_031169 [Daphnia magna]
MPFQKCSDFFTMMMQFLFFGKGQRLCLLDGASIFIDPSPPDCQGQKAWPCFCVSFLVYRSLCVLYAAGRRTAARKVTRSNRPNKD